jgi:hypothetical protein
MLRQNMIGQRLTRSPRYRLFRRVAALLLVIAAVLGAVNLGLIVIRNFDAPTNPVPGQLLYLSTFDTFNDQWRQFPGQQSAEARDGQLLLVSDNPKEGFYSDLDRSFGNFDISVDATWVQTQSLGDEIGILFRLQDKQNYYMFKIRGDGAYSVVSMKNGQEELISQWQRSPYIKLGDGQTNRLSVKATNFLFQVYVNDYLLPLCLKGSSVRSTWEGIDSGVCISSPRVRPEFVDEAFSNGSLALSISSGTTPGLRVAFDNVYITGPRDPNSLGTNSGLNQFNWQ